MGPLRFRRLGGAYLITNDWGRWAILEPDQLRELCDGSLGAEGPLRAELEAKGFVRPVDVELAASTLFERRSSVAWGPYSHLLHLGDPGRTMSVETAGHCLDIVFGSTSPRLEIGFTGSDVLANGAVLDHVVEEAGRRAREVEKPVAFHLWSDLRGLEDARLEWLSERGFHVHVRTDAATFSESGAPDALRKLADAVRAASSDPAPSLELVVPCTRDVLGLAGPIVRTCVDLGCERLRLTPPAPAPLGPPPPEAPDLGEWLELRFGVLEAVLATNAEGKALAEHGAALLARRILTDGDPFDVELRSPATDGTGQLCYAWDGTVCTSEAGCLLYHRGDATFVVGKAGEDDYRKVMGHPTVRALLLSSLLEGQPVCCDCAFLPYCGQSPAHNYVEQGTIQGRMADSSWCRRMQASADSIFRLLRDGDPTTRATLDAWAAAREPRER